MSTATVPPPPELATLEIEIDGEIGTLTLNRPDSLNAMSPELIFELTVAAAWLADQAPLRALIVTGAGERRSRAGGDVNWFKRGLDDPEIDLPADVRRGAEVLHQAIVDFRRIPYPVIGAINGVAAGAGFSLALMCDIRIASAERGVRLRLRADRRLARRRHDLLPAAGGRARRRRSSCCSTTRCSAPSRRSSSGIVSKVVAADELVDGGAGEGRASSPPRRRTTCGWRSCSSAESLDNSLTDHLQARAPRDRRLDGDRGPARGRHRVLRRPRAGVHRATRARV